MSDTAKLVPVKELRTLQGHNGAVSAVVFNAKGEYCVSGGYDKILRLWNPHTAKLITQYRGHGYQIDSVDVHADNSQLASGGGDKTPLVWDVESGNIIRRFKGHDFKINCVRYNKDSSVLASGSLDKTAKLWDMRSRSYDPIQVLDHAKDSISTIFIATYEIVTGSVDGIVRTYDLRIGLRKEDTIAHPITSVSLSGDENVILVSTLDNTIRLLDKDDGSLYQEYKGHKNEYYPVQSCFNNTDAYVLSGSEDGKLFVWSLEEGREVFTTVAHKGRLSALSYHPTRALLLTGGDDKAIKVWGAVTES